jgi:RimJ/RimL family protein N-acetyltransferase
MTEPRVALVQVDRAVARALVDGDLSDLQAARGWPHEDTVVAFGAALARDDGELPWLVVRRDTGEVIGECGVKGPPDASGTVEIGYGLAGPSRGRGYGAEAVAALLEVLAERREVRRVLAEIEHTNVASRRLVERLGFRLERITSDCGYWTREV